jgi:hypothetical protein
VKHYRTYSLSYKSYGKLCAFCLSILRLFSEVILRLSQDNVPQLFQVWGLFLCEINVPKRGITHAPPSTINVPFRAPFWSSIGFGAFSFNPLSQNIVHIWVPIPGANWPSMFECNILFQGAALSYAIVFRAGINTYSLLNAPNDIPVWVHRFGFPR